VGDDKKWSRKGSKDEKETPEIEVLAEAEAIVEAQMAPTVWEKTGENPPYDTHLKFIGKKLSDINNNLNQTNENLWWLTIGIKTGLASMITGFGVLIIYLLSGLGEIAGLIGLPFIILGIIVLLQIVIDVVRKFLIYVIEES